MKEIFEDVFLNKLCATKSFQRLKNIGFLGAIDYSLDIGRNSRFEHSISVAFLALQYAKLVGLSEKETRLLSCAGLLHDIGHAPLSHSLEPIFEKYFGLSHHFIGRNILLGKSKFGNEIFDIAKEYKINLEEVQSMIDGKLWTKHSFLFSSPINFDTIDGIFRCHKYFTPKDDQRAPDYLISNLAGDKLPTYLLDRFWTRKQEAYNFIEKNLVYDILARAYMAANINNFSPNDFLIDEVELKEREPELFYLLSCMKIANIVKLFGDYLMDYEMEVSKRNFFIDKNISLVSHKVLWQRYRQNKVEYKTTLRELIKNHG